MQITNLYNKEGSLEDARPKSFGSEFSARLIWSSSTTRCHTSVASFFIHFNNPLWCITLGVIRYSTLPSRPSYWTFTLVLYIRRDAPHYFTMSAHPGFFPSSGILLCVGPHLLLLSGSSGVAVFKHTHSIIV
jgi:hypothetical protein